MVTTDSNKLYDCTFIRYNTKWLHTYIRCQTYHVQRGAMRSNSRRLCSLHWPCCPVTVDTFPRGRPALPDAGACGGAKSTIHKEILGEYALANML